MNNIGVPDVAQLALNLRERKFTQVVFLVGCTVSCAGDTPCADVAKIRNDLIFKPLIKAFCPENPDRQNSIFDLAYTLTTDNSVASIVNSIPFEAFMSCLNEVDNEASLKVIQAACHLKQDTIHINSFKPNGLHRLISKISYSIINKNYADSVIVLTTNYDLGLDLAFEELNLPKVRYQGIDQLDINIPTYTFLNNKLKYIKLHGCILEPKTLVFTMERLTKLTFWPNIFQDCFDLHIESHVNKRQSRLVISVGYSFSDPDLQPHWKRLFNNSECIVLRLTKRDINKRNLNISTTGSDYILEQFTENIFQGQGKYLLHPCNLFDATDHPLIIIANNLNIKLGKICVPQKKELPEEMQQTAVKAIAQLDHIKATEFLTRVCDYSALPNATCAINEIIFGKYDRHINVKNCWEERTSRWFYLSFRLQGYDCEYSEKQKLLCRKYRRSFSKPEAKLLGYGLCSFPLTINRPTLWKGIQALFHLYLAKMWYGRVSDNFSKNVFQHYDLHFKLKVRVKLSVWFEHVFHMLRKFDKMFHIPIDRSLEELGRRFVWGNILIKLDRLTFQSLNDLSMLSITETADLLVQCHLLLGRKVAIADLKIPETEKAVYIMKSAANAVRRPHTLALVERTHGWYELKRCNSIEAMYKALDHFCSAVILATYSTHNKEELLRKILPQCLRILGCISRRSGYKWKFPLGTNVIVSIEDIREACARLRNHIKNILCTHCVCRDINDWRYATTLAVFCFNLLQKQELDLLMNMLEVWTNPKRLEGDLFSLPIFPYA